MSEDRKSRVCKVLIRDAGKLGECQGVVKEFGEGKRDVEAVDRVIDRLSELSGFTREDVIKKIDSLPSLEEEAQPAAEAAVESKSEEAEASQQPEEAKPAEEKS